jgi:hypothetical protein
MTKQVLNDIINYLKKVTDMNYELDNSNDKGRIHLSDQDFNIALDMHQIDRTNLGDVSIIIAEMYKRDYWQEQKVDGWSKKIHLETKNWDLPDNVTTTAAKAVNEEINKQMLQMMIEAMDTYCMVCERRVLGRGKRSKVDPTKCLCYDCAHEIEHAKSIPISTK